MCVQGVSTRKSLPPDAFPTVIGRDRTKRSLDLRGSAGAIKAQPEKVI
jgi:hypothetical protein